MKLPFLKRKLEGVGASGRPHRSLGLEIFFQGLGLNNFVSRFRVDGERHV